MPFRLAKTRQVIGDVTLHLDNLDSPLAANALRDFGDVLTNWYVRRSRGRFWSGDSADAFDTLYTVLETLTRLAAPLLPLVAEKIWKGLTGGRSVHLTDWPDAAMFPEDDALVATMDRVREIASSGLGLRKATAEPAGGSDLGALRTRAVPDGDQWVINGQKIWTSGAHYCDWGHPCCPHQPGCAET